MSRRAFSALFALLLVATSTACGGDPQARLKRLRAKDVFTDARDVTLAEAVALGDRAAIDAAIKAGANVNGRGDKGMPMLMWAMVKDSVAGFDALLENGADLKALANDPAFTRKGERTKEVIELVVSGTNGDFLKTALAHGFNPDYVPDSYMNESLLFRSVWSHAIPNARLLLEAGADIDHLDSNKRPPIDLAMGIGHYEMVFFLLSSGADPCIKTNGYDLAGMMKEFGTRGVTEKEYPHFLRVVAELKKRGLITDEDITQADNKKPFSDPQP